MKPKLTLFTALAFAAATGAAAADDLPLRKPPTRALPEALKPYDANDDGRLSREEYKVYVDDHRPDTPKSQWDIDDDGKLSHEEIDAAREAMRERLKAKFLARFNEADANDDQVLTEEEFKDTLPDDVSEERAAAAFDRLDADDNSEISEEEFLKFSGLPPRPDVPKPPKPRPESPKPKPPVLPPLPEFLKALDLDGNGILSRSEIRTAMEEGTWPPSRKPPGDGEDGDEDEEPGDPSVDPEVPGVDGGV